MFLPREDRQTTTPQQTKPTLADLSHALRHPETWPQGFTWDFCSCRTCAMGLAAELWGRLDNYYRNSYPGAVFEAADRFGMPLKDAVYIFGGALWADAVTFCAANVTPVMVANLIDKYLAGEIVADFSKVKNSWLRAEYEKIADPNYAR